MQIIPARSIEDAASAFFGPSSAYFFPLAGVAFCRKGISVLRPLSPPNLVHPFLKEDLLYHTILYMLISVSSRCRTTDKVY